MSQIGFSFVNPAPQIDSLYVANFARRCEEIGAHSFWVLDRIAYDNLEPLTVLATAAPVTTKIRLGTSVLHGSTRDSRENRRLVGFPFRRAADSRHWHRQPGTRFCRRSCPI